MGKETDECLKGTCDFEPPTIRCRGSFYAGELAAMISHHAHRLVCQHAVDPPIVGQNEWIADAANVSTPAS